MLRTIYFYLWLLDDLKKKKKRNAAKRREDSTSKYLSQIKNLRHYAGSKIAADFHLHPCIRRSIWRTQG